MAENNGLLVIGIVIIVLLSVGLGYYAARGGAAAAPLNLSGNQNSSVPTITIQGQASKTVSPDLLTIDLSIKGTGATAAEAQADNAKESDNVRAALIAAGINQSDIQTSSYYTSQEYNGSCGCGPIVYPVTYGAAEGSGGVNSVSSGSGDVTPPDAVNTDSVANDSNPNDSGPAANPGSSGSSQGAMPVSPPPTDGSQIVLPCRTASCQIIGYTVTQSITVNSDDTSNGGKFVEAALGASNTTSVDDIYFSLKDSTRAQLQSDLQAEAALDARTKADSIAKGLGASLGKIVSVTTEDYGYFPPLYVYQNSGGVDAGTKDAVPPEIFPTDTTTSSSIMVVFELVQ